LQLSIQAWRENAACSALLLLTSYALSSPS
jgi:hypothetical protein